MVWVGSPYMGTSEPVGFTVMPGWVDVVHIPKGFLG